MRKFNHVRHGQEYNMTLFTRPKQDATASCLGSCHTVLLLHCIATPGRQRESSELDEEAHIEAGELAKSQSQGSLVWLRLDIGIEYCLLCAQSSGRSDLRGSCECANGQALHPTRKAPHTAVYGMSRCFMVHVAWRTS
jgi:hypothetical protein